MSPPRCATAFQESHVDEPTHWGPTPRQLALPVADIEVRFDNDFPADWMRIEPDYNTSVAYSSWDDKPECENAWRIISEVEATFQMSDGTSASGRVSWGRVRSDFLPFPEPDPLSLSMTPTFLIPGTDPTFLVPVGEMAHWANKQMPDAGEVASVVVDIPLGPADGGAATMKVGILAQGGSSLWQERPATLLVDTPLWTR